MGSRAVRSSRLASIAGNPDPSLVTAVRVELADGRTDYVVSSLDDNRTYLIDDVLRFRGRFGWLRIQGRSVTCRYKLGTKLLELVNESRPAAAPALTGRVTSFTGELSLTNEIVITHDPVPGRLADTVSRLVGSWIHVANDGERNACYRIETVEVVGRDQLRLGLGAQTLVRSLADPTNADGGYTHDVANEAAITVPLGYEG